MTKQVTNPSDNRTRSAVKTPLVRITRRNALPLWKSISFRVGAFLFALLLTAGVIALLGVNPFTFFSKMWSGTFGNKLYLWEMLKAAAKLLFVAVALAPAFKMHFWNIGAEGQFLIGSLASTLVVQTFGSSFPTPVLLLMMMVASILAGCIWGLIPAVFKAKFDTNETLFTLMMNYIVIQLVQFAREIWRGNSQSYGTFDRAGWLRALWNSKPNTSNFLTTLATKEEFWYVLVAVLAAVVMYFYLAKTKHGYEIAVVGGSKNTARYAGISVNKVMIRTMILSGAICGFCGFMTSAAQSHTVSTSVTGGYGFTAIIVAWLSKFNTFIMAGVSLLLVVLELGAKNAANGMTSAGVPSDISSVVVGIMLFCIIASEFLIQYRLIFRHAEKKEVKS